MQKIPTLPVSLKVNMKPIKFVFFTMAGILAASCIAGAQVANSPLEELKEQNRVLQEQVKRQQEMIESINSKLNDLQRGMFENSAKADSGAAGSKKEQKLGDKVHLGGEVGLDFFWHPKRNINPVNPASEFRVDTAKINVEASIWKNVYMASELIVSQREIERKGPGSENVRIGSFYLEAEDVSNLWGKEGQMTLRLGRFDIPFGEEYAVRDVMNDPLITHSVADFWGIDEGLEAYGKLGAFDYTLAIQNGGHPILEDYNDDKSVALRLGYRPSPWFRVSASAMRTGKIKANIGRPSSNSEEKYSEMWFANGFFRAITNGSPTTFEVNLAEVDFQFDWKSGRAAAFVGGGRYDDTALKVNNNRNLWFWSVEASQDLTEKIYMAGRYSGTASKAGLPMAGLGDYGAYFEDLNSPLTEELHRLSIGLGYRFSPRLVLKAEYCKEMGKLIKGSNRDVDLVGMQVGIKF